MFEPGALMRVLASGSFLDIGSANFAATHGDNKVEKGVKCKKKAERRWRKEQREAAASVMTS